ncbi:hypothetical protein NU090_004156 [Salmonella enterica]|nr:hypothetical protein [Salmonella enterica]ECQ3861604.1 hypothetical protein [Salmonella enterica]EDC5089031.1 hypothetical protein [Salmonella enterica]EEK5473534.1 hypothetical protein [Salmonella enterica]EHE6384951.1 hypothetical protein [Salmonella enterica]
MDNEDKKEWLAEIGETIFGDHWKPALAKHLGTDDSLVRKWASGTRTIPDSLIRGLLSLAHDRANMISRHADRFARELRHEPGYERIIYIPGIKLDSVRSDLYTEKRDCFDIDGRLFLLNENGTVIDVHGYETDGYGMPVLPDNVTVKDLLLAKQKHLSE